ncbi:MAG: SDR family oxidoreductase [Phycisphaerales bacterium]|nr:SDR family oxidoreductase [Phycisphaerales bacterium]|tara:strand:- start:1674 stop:2672 length:999 start_codon:yes stop_codon:yes gene_type:complete
MGDIGHRVLVTGGAGFLGSHLCDRLLARGHEVTCLDSFLTSQRRTIAHLEANDRFTLIEHDIIDPIELQTDAIFNLACPAAPGHYQAEPMHTWRTSVYGVDNMVEVARRNQAPIFHSSTSEVYGDPDCSPQPESYRGNVNPIGPRACYDEGKRAAETLLFDARRRGDVQVKVVRIFNTYGPRMHPYDGRVVSNFIRQAINGEDITIFGDGSQTRSFCYVDDLIDGFLAMMEGPEDLSGPVNLGNPQERTILDLAQRVLEKIESSSQLVTKPLPPDDPLQRRPDITLATDRLGWKPRVDLEEGLEATIEAFRGLDLEDWTPPTKYWQGPPLTD